jgi:regulator of RNase E activity RraA
MLAVEVSELPPQPYHLLMELLDGLRPGEVVVGAVQAQVRAALWGELLSTHTRAKGGRGVVLDGLSRDSWGIVEMKFPVFATGLSPADSKGRLEVISIRGTIPVGGVSVADGDLLVADSDGCVVVPAAIEDDVIAKAMDKVSGEDTMRDILRKGANLREVFKEYGIL